MNILKPEERKLFALILMCDPLARQAYIRLKNMRATNLRLDYMLNRQADGTYARNPDPGAWNADLLGGKVLVTAIRRNDEWSLHGS